MANILFILFILFILSPLFSSVVTAAGANDRIRSGKDVF